MNPLKELSNLVASKKKKRYVAKVIKVQERKLTVIVGTARVTVWGQAHQGDRVLIEGDKVIAVVAQEDKLVVIVP